MSTIIIRVKLMNDPAKIFGNNFENSSRVLLKQYWKRNFKQRGNIKKHRVQVGV